MGTVTEPRTFVCGLQPVPSSQKQIRPEARTTNENSTTRTLEHCLSSRQRSIPFPPPVVIGISQIAVAAGAPFTADRAAVLMRQVAVDLRRVVHGVLAVPGVGEVLGDVP